jgi:hypothetical protein
MASFVKFEVFAEDLANGVHDLFGTDHVLKFYLTNATPNVATHEVKADLAEITNQNGYTAPIDIENNGVRTGGTVTIEVVDKQVAASGGTVGPFRYAVVYNDTPTSPVDPLIGYFDYGSAITLQAGETFDLDFGTDDLLTVA